jgi:hypothetical protein
MNGTDDPENIERITIEEHAERHRILYETHGYEQDRIAWLSLSGQITHAEAIKLSQKAPKSDRWKATMSERNSGEGNPMYGKTYKHSEETKQYLSEKMKVAANKPDFIAKVKETWTGREHKEESKALISQNRKGKGLWKGTDRIPPNTGKKQSDHQKAVVSELFSKKWKVTTPTGETIEVVNLRQYCADLGFNPATAFSNMSRGGYKGYRAIRQ